jgi:hypothetical protein
VSAASSSLAAARRSGSGGRSGVGAGSGGRLIAARFGGNGTSSEVETEDVADADENALVPSRLAAVAAPGSAFVRDDATGGATGDYVDVGAYDWRHHAHVLPLFTDQLLLARPSVLRYLASMDVDTLDLAEARVRDDAAHTSCLSLPHSHVTATRSRPRRGTVAMTRRTRIAALSTTQMSPSHARSRRDGPRRRVRRDRRARRTRGAFAMRTRRASRIASLLTTPQRCN